MAAPDLTVLLLGDEAENVTFSIAVLYRKSQTSVALTKFLQEASHACQSAFGSLPSCIQTESASFTSLLDLSKKHSKAEGSSALAGFALGYFARLGELVYRSETDPGIFNSGRILIIGSGTGLLPAGIVAASTSSTTVAQNAIQCFPSCFSFITDCYHRTMRVESSYDSWSYTVADNLSEHELQLMLNTFHTEFDIPYHKEAWISGNCAGQLILSGPPSTLKKLRIRLPGLNRVVSIALHASHLPAVPFDKTALPKGLQERALRNRSDIISTSLIEPYKAKRLGDLMDAIAQDVVQHSSNMRVLLREMHEDVMKYMDTHVDCSIIQLGPFSDTPFFADDLVGDIELKPDLECKPGSGRGFDSAAVAIVGVSMRMPKAGNMEELWNLMMTGNTARGKMPHDRLHEQEPIAMSGEGCFLDNPGAFDPDVFKLTSAEASQIKQTHRLLLMACLEALAAAGYNPQGRLPTAERTGFYFAQNGPIRRTMSAIHGADGYTIAGLLKAFNSFSSELDSDGSRTPRGLYDTNPYFPSSATAIQSACATLMNRKCDVALAGGAQVISNALELIGWNEPMSQPMRDGCRAFCQKYCPGEAVGVLVLKRLDDAIANGDKVEAVIKGWACNQPIGPILDVDSPFYSDLLIDTFEKAGIAPEDLGYAEHDGARAGVLSGNELYALGLLADGILERPLPIGTVKANIGHSGSAAGVSSVIRALMMLKRGMIPPQASFPEGELGDMRTAGFLVHTKATELDDSKKVILIHDVDGAGANTSLIITPAPESVSRRRGSDPRKWHVVAISAASQAALENNTRRLSNHLVANPEVKLADIAYTTTARRIHHPIRQHIVATSTIELANRLEAIDLNMTTVEKPKVVFVFSGHGHNYHGVVEELYQSHGSFRDTLDRLETLCYDMSLTKRKTFLDVLKTTWSRVCPPVEQSLAIVCLEIALAELWQSWGVKPDLVIGHDLGEYTALCVAGVLSVADTLWLITKRAVLARTSCTKYEWGMVSLKGTESEVNDALKASGYSDSCKITWHNSPVSHAVCGLSEELFMLVKHGHLEKVKPVTLDMPYVFHSAQMEIISKHLKGHASAITFHSPQIPVASTLTGELICRKGIVNAEYLEREVQSPIDFVKALETIHAEVARDGSSSLWVGIGHQEPLNYARDTLNLSPSQLLPCLEAGENNFKAIAASVGQAYSAGIDINWPEFHRPFERLVHFIDLPTYAFDMIDCGLLPEKHISAAERTRREFIPTATVQRIDSQDVNETKIKVSFSSSLMEKRLRSAIEGHKIEGQSVCPISVYVDMATTAANHVRKLLSRPGDYYVTWLERIKLVTPLKLADSPKTIKITITANLKDDCVANVSIYTQDHTDAIEHCKCQVLLTIERKAWDEDAVTADLQALIDMDRTIRDRIGSGKCSMTSMYQGAIYKLLGPSMEYSDRYQGVEEVIIVTDIVRAGRPSQITDGNVKLTYTPKDAPMHGASGFAINPYHLDSLTHIAGFMALDYLHESERRDWTYICTDIGVLRLYKALIEGEDYHITPVMIFRTQTELHFTIFVTEYERRSELIGYFDKVKFQKIKQSELRKVMVEGRRLDDNTLFQPSSPLLRLRDPSTSPESESPVITPDHSFSQLSIHDDTDEGQKRRDELNTIQGLNSGAIIDLEDQADTKFGEDGTDDDEDIYDDNETAPLAPELLKSPVVHVTGYEPSPYKMFFLIPGAGGTHEVLHDMPPLPSMRPVMVLENPLVTVRPSSLYKPSDLTRAYAKAIMECQHKGTYHIGGYGEGAIYAYEVARALAMLYGKTVVEKLILIDMKAHAPGQLGAAKPTIWDITKLTEELQLGTDWKKEQKLMLNDALCAYNWKPEPLEPHFRPMSTSIIWAKDGMCERDEDAEFETEFPCQGPDFAPENQGYMAWFRKRRHAYDAGGWDTLIGEEVKVHVSDGDHFSMIERPHSAKLVDLLDQILREVTMTKIDAEDRQDWIRCKEKSREELEEIGVFTSRRTTTNARSAVPRSMRTGTGGV
ncbi:hypothetical protein GGR57DRAFT_512052 [Xylariaceae sp. FL1272]|nr:hypothetical protein GGR57DRAFT_512052 [Xylariaceae sp. FL1272]